MNCPKCGGRTKVRYTYHTIDNQIIRPRKCSDCGYTIYSVEHEVEYSGSLQYMINNAESFRKRVDKTPYEKRLDSFESIGMEPEELCKAAEVYRYLKDNLQ